MRGGSRRNSDGDACVLRKGICVHSNSINSSQSGETAFHRGCDFRSSPFFLPVGRRSSVAEVLHKENENLYFQFLCFIFFHFTNFVLKEEV